MNREEVRSRIEEVGILPAIRAASAETAEFAAVAVGHAGIPLAEITVTVPQAETVIAKLRRSEPDMVVGAGTILDLETARRCLDAGAEFLTSPGFVPEVVEFARKQNVAVLPGALTPSEIIEAWKAGADLVKVFPCAQVGGPSYVRALRAPFPDIPLIASGGVNQRTALDFILAGATALGIGGQLLPAESVARRQEDRIRELARRFLKMVSEGRSQRARR
jgi:2-dehydro-3-deoxyphosphogluconate aldolase/(4S)-4-hydroxy-2-oxoglutarate aldolase